MRDEKNNVKKFYDSFGWNRLAGGGYKDTVTFVDTRQVLDTYYHRVHMRLKKFIEPHGTYFLDAGSGA